MATRFRFSFLLLLVPAIVFLAGPAGGAASGAADARTEQAAMTGAPAASREAPKEAAVQIVAMRLVPDRLEITTGTTVTWVNNEPLDYPGVGGGHELVADDGSWRSPNIAPGTRWSRRFDQPGTFNYHSARHSTVTGAIAVTGEPIVDRPVEQEVAITEENPDDPKSWGFRPPDLLIEPGTTVVWRNNGKNVHTVNANDKSFDSGDIQPGATWRHTFDAPGAFAYHCTPHPWMKAQLRVVAPGSEAPPPVAAEHESQASAPVQRTSNAQPQRVGRGPVRHEVAIIEPDPAMPFEWTFDPATLDVKVGDTVVWHNTGAARHTVTSDTFDSKLIDPGASWEHRFDRAGIFAYHCTPHPWMKGVVRVSDLDAEALPPLHLDPPSTTTGTARTLPPRAVEAERTGNGPVRHEAHILEPDLQKAMEWRFDPPTLEARVGDTVAWSNTGTLQHTVTADNGAFDSGMIDPGKTFEHRFDTPGVYAYHCTPHPWMKAVVRVTDATGAAPPPPPAGPGEQAAAPLSQGSVALGGPFKIPPQAQYHPSMIFPISLAVAAAIIALACYLAEAPWRRPTRPAGPGPVGTAGAA